MPSLWPSEWRRPYGAAGRCHGELTLRIRSGDYSREKGVESRVRAAAAGEIRNMSTQTRFVEMGGAWLYRWWIWGKGFHRPSQKSQSYYQAHVQWLLNDTGGRDTNPSTVKIPHINFYSPKLNYSQSFVPSGFTLVDSTNCGSKTVFSIWSWESWMQRADYINSLMLTSSLTDNINSQLTHILYVTCIMYCNLTIKVCQSKEEKIHLLCLLK